MDLDSEEKFVILQQGHKRLGDDAVQQKQYMPAVDQYKEAEELSNFLYGKKDKRSLEIQYAIAWCYLRHGTLSARELALERFMSILNTVRGLLFGEMRRDLDEADDELKDLARKTIERLESIALSYCNMEAYLKADQIYPDIHNSALAIFGMPDTLTIRIRDNMKTNARKLPSPPSSVHSEHRNDDRTLQSSRHSTSSIDLSQERTTSIDERWDRAGSTLLGRRQGSRSEPGPPQDIVNMQQSRTAAALVSSNYRLPHKLEHSCSWADAVDQAKLRKKWLMVNFQKQEYLESLVLNRSLWRHAAIQLLILKRFQFLQYYDTDVEKQHVPREYLPKTDRLKGDDFSPYPSVVIVDPVTLQKRKIWMERFPPAAVFLAELHDFLTCSVIGTDQPSSHGEGSGFDDVRLLKAKNETPILLRSDDCESKWEWFDRCLEQKTHQLLRQIRIPQDRPTDKSSRRVRIAVLDTGIDFAHKVVKEYVDKERIRMTKSWIPNRPGDTDEDGHGTHTAMLLLRVAPEAELYVAKVFTDGLNVTKEHVAQAILWAVDIWEVDIITMSFGFQKHSDDISGAIAHAVAAKVLLFAAASNNGGNDKNARAYPARDYRVFCIHSTDAYGNPSRFNPPPLPHEPNFSILGQDVVSASRDGQWESKSGTSVATPIAAATAALLLEFLRVGQKTGTGKEKMQHLSRASTLEGMKHLFLTMSRNIQGYNYVCPWLLLSAEPNTDHTEARQTAEDAVIKTLKEVFDGI